VISTDARSLRQTDKRWRGGGKGQTFKDSHGETTLRIERLPAVELKVVHILHIPDRQGWGVHGAGMCQKKQVCERQWHISSTSIGEANVDEHLTKSIRMGGK